MKNIFKNIIYFFLSKMSFHGAVVLMYHSIGYNNEFFTVRTEEFEEQMSYLSKKKFNVISLTKMIKKSTEKIYANTQRDMI